MVQHAADAKCLQKFGKLLELVAKSHTTPASSVENLKHRLRIAFGRPADLARCGRPVGVNGKSLKRGEGRYRAAHKVYGRALQRGSCFFLVFLMTFGSSKNYSDALNSLANVDCSFSVDKFTISEFEQWAKEDGYDSKVDFLTFLNNLPRSDDTRTEIKVPDKVLGGVSRAELEMKFQTEQPNNAAHKEQNDMIANDGQTERGLPEGFLDMLRFNSTPIPKVAILRDPNFWKLIAQGVETSNQYKADIKENKGKTSGLMIYQHIGLTDGSLLLNLKASVISEVRELLGMEGGVIINKIYAGLK